MTITGHDGTATAPDTVAAGESVGAHVRRRSSRDLVSTVLPPSAVTSQLASAVLVELRAELERAVAAEDAGTRSRVHELIAGCRAARGEWMQAYLELRASVDLTLDRTPGSGQEQRLLAEMALLRREHAAARDASIRDSLTETFNRRFLDDALRSLTEQRRQAVGGLATDTCVALVDLDLFKLVNDTFGHAMGDTVLQRVVELLQVDLPDKAFCARYGGEEFVLVLPGGGLATAVELCERARARVEEHDWSTLAEGLLVTVSIGVACPSSSSGGAPGSAGQGAHDQLLRADALLYGAKTSGRNAVAYRTDPDGPLQLAGGAGHRRVLREPGRAGT